MPRKILIPLPDLDFDVTEVAVPWRLFTDAGHEVVFATEHGATPAADPLLLRGVLFGKLGADPEPRAFYDALTHDPAFQSPRIWANLDMHDFDALLLPGGHAQGMRQYLGSEVLQRQVATFWALRRPVAAICHGVLVLARCHDPATGKSLLWNRRTTCLPAYMERLAYYLSAWKLGRYYRTYPAYVETEVRAALERPSQFVRGPLTIGSRGSANDDRHAFIVEDDNYLSARWPGDAYLLARRFLEVLAAGLTGDVKADYYSGALDRHALEHWTVPWCEIYLLPDARVAIIHHESTFVSCELRSMEDVLAGRSRLGLSDELQRVREAFERHLGQLPP